MPTKSKIHRDKKYLNGGSANPANARRSGRHMEERERVGVRQNKGNRKRGRNINRECVW